MTYLHSVSWFGCDYSSLGHLVPRWLCSSVAVKPLAHGDLMEEVGNEGWLLGLWLALLPDELSASCPVEMQGDLVML